MNFDVLNTVKFLVHAATPAELSSKFSEKKKKETCAPIGACVLCMCVCKTSFV